MKSAVAVLALFNGLMILTAVLLTLGAPGVPGDAAAAAAGQTEGQPAQGGGAEGLKALSAAIAIGLGAISAGIAVAVVGSAAVGGISRNPEIFGRSLVFVGLAEGIAIYGLIVAFMILTG